MGHLHLHVGDVDGASPSTATCSASSCRPNLGSAAFVSAGGYHHHLGFNVWHGRGVGPAPEHTAGLRHWTVQLPSVAEVRVRAEAAGVAVEPADGGFLVRDPWQTAVHFTST